MTRDDIIRMAKEAGIFTTDLHCATASIDIVERFAALVAAHEREQCAKVCEHRFSDGALVLAAAIRARGQT